MRKPVEWLQYRLDTMTAEYERILHLEYGSNRVGRNAEYVKTFDAGKRDDLSEIKKEMDSYRAAIILLS